MGGLSFVRGRAPYPRERKEWSASLRTTHRKCVVHYRVVRVQIFFLKVVVSREVADQTPVLSRP